jgi:hypothetical protein
MSEQAARIEQREVDYQRGLLVGDERGYQRGVKEGIDKGDSRTTIIGICAIASVLLGFTGAILVGDMWTERQRTARIQAACSGSLEQPGPAVACALVSVRGRAQ